MKPGIYHELLECPHCNSDITIQVEHDHGDVYCGQTEQLTFAEIELRACSCPLTQDDIEFLEIQAVDSCEQGD